MKKLLLALLIMPLCSFGQISLRPHIGAGCGMVSQEGSLITRERSDVFIQNVGLSGVYWLNNWFVSAGVGYLTTGFAYDLGSLNIGPFDEPPIYVTNARVIYKYHHLTLPVTVGRKFSLQKFSVLPEAGFDLAYNLSEKSRLRTDQNPDTDFKKNSQFPTEFNRISVFANLSVTASYKLTDRLSVFCGPSYKYMMTDIVKQKTNGLTGASISQHHHAILLNAGVYIGLQQ